MNDTKVVVVLMFTIFCLCLTIVVAEHNHKEPTTTKKQPSVTINGKVITPKNCLAGEVPVGYTVTLDGVLCKNPRE